MNCPTCKIKLEEVVFSDISVDHCPDCHGVWFQEDELRLAKDKKDENLKWVDVDLWKNKRSFKISKSNKICPECRLPLYEVTYGKSKIKVDLCNICKGIWLDKGEFKQIVDYLKKEADWKVFKKYGKTLAEEAMEIFSGPESVREELEDFLTVLKLFKYKFITEHPKIAQIIIGLPK
jgi:Zn-finger nucleic acid-binding protein